MRKLFVTLVKCAVLLVVVFGSAVRRRDLLDKIVGLFGKAKQLCAEKAALLLPQGARRLRRLGRIRVKNVRPIGRTFFIALL